MTPLSDQTLPPNNFDTGPLSWVMNEIREALQRSRALVTDALTQDADTQSTSVRQARSFLHQAHGALQIVDLDGVSVLTEAVEKMLDGVLVGKPVLDATLARVYGTACSAIVEYLEEMLSGALHQPVRLYPYYKDALQACGNDRAHPSDLFFPNLSIKPQLPVEPQGEPVQFAMIRQRFERALLPFLRAADPEAGRTSAAAMAALVGEVERAQATPDARRFWWILRGFAEGVANGEIAIDIHVRQLFGRINLQLRRLAEGSQGAVERLGRDALFFIAAAERPSGRTAQVKSAYQLAGQVPADYERRRYGQVDQALLAAAREHLNQAKNRWSALAGGNQSAGAGFEQHMQALAEVGARLGAPSLEKLLRELNGIARAAHSAAGEALALEMAGSLLFVENALNHASRLSEGFGEKAEALTARLLAVVAGESPATQTQWLDDMSRDAQQKETVGVLAGEMRTSLNQVEKGLEEFFGDATRRAALPVVDSTLHQIEGALDILEQEEARLAIANARAAVGRFRDLPPEAGPSADESQRVARNLGALSFFMEMLQKQPALARERFVFDPVDGSFQARLATPGLQATLDVVIDPLPEAAAIAVAAASLASTAAEAPAQPALDAPDVINVLDVLPVAMNVDASQASVPDPASPEAAASAAAVQAEAEADAGIDAELLEIFLGEAGEVLEAVHATLPQLEAQPANVEHLTGLRRAFHTLKGSGRMVGLNAFGEAAWSIEQVLNLQLADGKAATPDLAALLKYAASVLGAWVQDLTRSGSSARTPDALVAAAGRMRDGLGFSLDEEAVAAAAASPDQSLLATAPDDGMLLSWGEPELDGSQSQPGLSAPVESTAGSTVDSPSDSPASAAAYEPPAFVLSIDEEITATLPAEADPFTPDFDGDELLDLPLLDEPAPGAASAAQEFPALSFDFTLDAAGDGLADSGAPAAAAPGLPDLDPVFEPVAEESGAEPAGAAESGIPPDLSFSLSDDHRESQPADLVLTVESDATPVAPVIDFAADEVIPPAPHAPQLPDLAPGTTASGLAQVIDLASARTVEPRADDNIKRVGPLEISLPLYNIYLAETDDLVRLLAHDFDEWRHEPARPVHRSSVHAAHSLSGSSATVGFNAVHELAHALEMILQSLARRPVNLLGSDFLLMLQAVERIKAMLATFALGDLPPDEPALLAALEGRLEDLVLRPAAGAGIDHYGSEAAAHALGEQAAAHALGEQAAAAAPAEPTVSGQPGAVAPEATATAPAAAPVSEALSAASKPEDPRLASDSYSASARSGEPEVVINDELDPDLLPVFIEEGGDILPQIGRELRGWQAALADSAHPAALLRLLHTIKGSARMAGAMSFGQHMHEMESRIEHICSLGTPARDQIDELLNRLDNALSLFDRLQLPVLADGAVSSLPGMPVSLAVAGAMTMVTSLPPGAHATVAAAPVPLVRVRADVLDRLVNRAGEVSIARSRAETEIDGLRQSLVDLTENVGRLRAQLREIEIQAESQMTSQMASNAEREFDPLEFDRFTRLQELTRMMAESVNDVASLQGSLTRTLDNTDVALLNQARLTRELQQDLMRVRMVQFASISERLYGVARQAAKEVDKRVNLEVRGGSVEIDRGVLEKMAGPFEHLLRNAIVHGIETRAERLAAGKNEFGDIHVEVRQEGNEVVIQFSDDGRGLDLQRIRARAQAQGLLATDAEPAESELREMIFQPGFSTADEVTALAGRGVGMDAVRSEAAALGGRVEVHSEPGQGARFLVRLPLTLAVTQVVLLQAGGKVFAVPSVLVEQVQQLKTGMLASAYNDGAINWQNQRVSLHYLSSLLGDADSVPVTQQYSPVVVLRSGNDRVAIHVDEVVGNREVVVKNIGPQLSRLVGIAGATVLGTGDIVLILNPVPLAQRAALGAIRAPRLLRSNAPQDMGAVAEMGNTIKSQSEPVQGLRSQAIVMVVDDSLTVRRVTQRLLAREGYQVVLAKDGIDALEQLQAITPDIMLLDIEMPRMDGFDLARNVRSDERTRAIPIVMITSRTAAKHRNYALELGVNEYLGKPYQENELLGLVKTYTRRELALD
ncbi:MAG: chemotaxis protein histidine kinaselike protein [Paucimonas sp.]|nr:chemotaxis protein histidine kinaselike protein [Paucimonas sp.]